jgi:hypothetical protein
MTRDTKSHLGCETPIDPPQAGGRQYSMGRDESLSTLTGEVTFFSQQAPDCVRTSEADWG